MRNGFIIFLISLFIIEKSCAMYREDVEGAPERANMFARKFPYQLGFIFGESSEVASAIFLDDTTALTSAHTQMLHNKNEKQIIISCDEFNLIQPPSANTYSFTESFKRLISGENTANSWSFYTVRFLSKFEKIEAPLTQALVNLSTYLSTDIDKELNDFKDPEKFIFPLRQLCIRDTNYQMDGSDFAILKLKKPIELTKKTVTLPELEVEKLTQYPAFSFGYVHSAAFSNGKITRYLTEKKDNTIQKETKSQENQESQKILTHRISAISLPGDWLKYSKNENYFYATYLSPGGNDEKFVPRQLLTESDKIHGRIFQGMSGGPLFFETKEGEFVFGGLVSQTFSPQFIFILKQIKENSAMKGVKSRHVKKASNLLKKYENEIMPTYDVYQTFSDTDISTIKSLMGKFQAPEDPRMSSGQ